MTYNRNIVTAFYREFGIPDPAYEYYFHPERKWRFDLAWLDAKLALEVQGGVFVRGRHTQGAALKKEWEKLNTAAAMGWRILYVEPSELCLTTTAKLIAQALITSII